MKPTKPKPQTLSKSNDVRKRRPAPAGYEDKIRQIASDAGYLANEARVKCNTTKRAKEWNKLYKQFRALKAFHTAMS